MKTNQELLEEANKIDFVLMKSGGINYRKHSVYERGLFFIKKAIELHGIDKYQYGLVQYVDNSTKVEILCPDHGSFFIQPYNHHMGKGCAKCANKHTPTTEEWVERAKNTHGDRYDYSMVVYKKAHEKVTIICRIHGPFEQAPSNHIHGQGCARCCSNYACSTSECIEKAIEVHGDRYDYSNVVYKTSKEKILIRCRVHGIFEQSPDHHLTGYGCIRCGNTYSYTTEEWVEKAMAVHGDRYDYSNVVYNVGREKVLIRCLVHGDFLQEAASHLSGKGCPKCKGKNHNIIYLLRCRDTGWYKIGITTNDTKNRISQIGGNIEELYHVVCDDPKKHESILHKKYAKDREYNLLVKSGNTEFFSLNEEQVKQAIDYMSSIAINQKSI